MLVVYRDFVWITMYVIIELWYNYNTYPTIDNSKTFKKPKTATVTTVSSQSSGPITPHRSSTEKSDSVETDKNKRNTEKSLFESLTENVKEPVQGSKISHHRKSVDAATIQSPRHSTDHDDSE